MGFSNGQLETSLASGKGERGEPGLPGIGFNLTDDGNFDIDGKRLVDVAQPIDNGDVANKEYVDDENEKQDNAINSKAEKSYVDSEVAKLKDHAGTNYHLQPSFTFYKDFGDKAELTKSNLSIPSHTDHLDLLEAPRQSVRDGFAYSNIKLTNNLSPATYSILFEIFGYDGSKIVTDGQDDRLLFYNVEGDVRIPDFDHEWFSNYAKSFLIFSNSKNVVNITLELRYYGSSNSNFKFLFYSRCVKGVEKLGFNHKIFNVKSTDFVGNVLFFQPINMNNEKIINLAEPTGNKGAATKGYVDTQIANIPKPNLSSYLKADGSVVMTGGLKMGGNAITGISSSSQDNAALTVGGALSTFLPLSGSRSMQGNLKCICHSEPTRGMKMKITDFDENWCD